MTIPTQLTVLRILLTFVLMGLLFVPGLAARIAVLVGFLFAGLTDWLDGYLARRWNQLTPLGALLDPIADKVCILGMLLVFVQLRLVPAWMVLIIAAREFLITGVRLFAASRHIVLAAAKEGKHKTVSQIVAIIVILSVLVVSEAVKPQALAGPIGDWLEWLVLGSMWVAMLLTLISGVSFFWRHRAVLRDAVSR